jgi:uncharacterized protein (TIGR02147 family)
MPASQLTPFVYSSHTDFLKAVREQYGERKKKISLQMWAERLGYQSSRSLELVISGDRFPSEDLMLKLCQDLRLSAQEQKYFGLMVQREKKLQKKIEVHDIEKEMDRIRPDRFEARYIDNEIFRRISEWYPLVIRQLAMTPGFKKDLSWIAGRLRGKVTLSQVAACLAELEQLALDRRALYTSEDIPSAAVRTFHKKMLHKAIEAVDEIDVEKREYISMTFRTSKKKLPEMKKMLRAVRDQLNGDLNEETGTEVFQLCLALFPHTNL